MINRELLKSEIDKIPQEFYGVLFKILESFKKTKRFRRKIRNNARANSVEKSTWSKFINQTYGSLSEYPIERGNQGTAESRDKIV